MLVAVVDCPLSGAKRTYRDGDLMRSWFADHAAIRLEASRPRHVRPDAKSTSPSTRLGAGCRAGYRVWPKNDRPSDDSRKRSNQDRRIEPDRSDDYCQDQ